MSVDDKPFVWAMSSRKATGQPYEVLNGVVSLCKRASSFVGKDGRRGSRLCSHGCKPQFEKEDFGQISPDWFKNHVPTVEINSDLSSNNCRGAFCYVMVMSSLNQLFPRYENEKSYNRS